MDDFEERTHEEEPPLKKARKLVKKNVDTIDEDEVLDLNGQSQPNMDDDDGGDDFEEDMDDEEDETHHYQYRFVGRSQQGFNVPAEDLREAQEIFGEGLDDLDEEDIEEDTADREETRAKASYEYFQQLQSFSLASDEEIRNADYPERFNFIFDGIRDMDVNYEYEALWIVRKLQEQAKTNKTEFSDFKAQELIKGIPAILEMIHEAHLEVPTIWLYKKDYLPKQLSPNDTWEILISRSELWDIFFLDVKFRRFEKEKLASIKILKQLELDAERVSEESERNNVVQSIRHILKEIEFSANDDTTEFAIAAIPMVVQRLQSVLERGSTRNKSTYSQFSHSPVVRTIVNALMAPAHYVGQALKNDVELDIGPSSISAPSFQQMVATLLSTEDHTPSESEVSRISGAAFSVATKEVSFDPLVRNLAKKCYLEEGSLSTIATERGLSEISPFSEYFGLQSIHRKPLKELLTADGVMFFMRLLDAEQKGLITVEFQNPFKEMSHNAHRHSAISSFSDRIFKCIVQPSNAEVLLNEEAKNSFDEARLLLFEKLMGDNIAPLAIKDAKAELIRLGRQVILQQACENFETQLRNGPLYNKFSSVSKNLQIGRLLAECPNRPRCQKVVGMFISPDHGSIDAVCVDSEGAVVSTCLMPTMLTTDWEEKLKLFLFDHRPESIVLNVSGREKTNRVKNRIENKIIQDVNDAIRIASMTSDEEDAESIPTRYSVDISIFDDEIPCIFMRSRRAKEMFSELAPSACAALSLARLAIEPLLEYCSLWKGVDSSGTFGFEAMYLKLHPLQDMIKGEKKMLLQALEMKVVQAVSDVGVDIHHATRHPHYGVMLAFLPGLGLRKAEKLIRDIARRPDKVSSRFALHDQALFLSDIVWTNACGFMRLSLKQGYQRFNPLDNTRIHPMCYEVYDFVRRICADALDVVNKPESQAQIIADVKSNIRKTIEKYFFPDKDGVIKWERVLDVVEFGSSVIGDGGFSRKYKEIKDALEVLVLTDYAEELEVGEKGKRLLELEMIKDELRYPWLDLRRFNSGYSQDEFKNYLKRESLISTHLGQKVPVKVIEIRNGRSPFIIVETDDGVRGFVGESDISDDRREYRHEELCSMVSVGERRVGVIIGLRYGDKLVISFRPSVCERGEAWWMRNRVDAAQDERDWWHFFCTKNGKSSDLRSLFDRYFDETEALDAYEKIEQATRAKAIEQKDATKLQGESARQAPQFEKIDHAVRFHPFFVNMTAHEAENYLRRKMAENRMPTPAVIRPSSKGPAHLALVWAFRPDKFMHIRVDQVPNLRDPSRPMYVIDHPSSNRPFSDIDEIFSEYIGRMHDFVLAMTRHKNFHAGRQAEVESDMRRQVTENPDRVAYYLRYEDETPGVFAITWMDKTLACKAVKILVTNTGFQAGSKLFSSPSEIVTWLKKLAQEPAKAAPVKRQSRFA